MILKTILKQKSLTAIAVLSPALGIGVNTTLFNVLDARLLKMLHVKEPGASGALPGGGPARL